MKRLFIASLLLPAAALCAEYTGEGANRKEACTAAVGRAATAGFEISPYDCLCDPVQGSTLTRCAVDSTGAVRIPAAGSRAAAASPAPPLPAVPAQPARVAQGAALGPDREQCQALRSYLDGTLKTEHRKAERSIAASRNSLALLAEVRQQVQGDLKASAAMGAAYKLTLVSKLTSTAVADILKAYPPTGRAMEASEKLASLTTRLVLKAADGVDVVQAPDQYFAKEMVSRVPVVGPLAVGSVNLAQNLAELKEASADGDEVLDITEAGLKSQERLVTKVKTRLDAAAFRLQVLNRVAADIRALCTMP